MDILRQVESLLETRDDVIPEDRRTDIAALDYNSQNYWVQAITAAKQSRSLQHTPAPPNRHSPGNYGTKQPWTSRWGIAQVLEQIRTDSQSAQASGTPWWGVDPHLLLKQTPIQTHTSTTNPRRNAAYRRRKPD